MTSEEVRLALKKMDEEDEEITVLLDELIDTCGTCGKRTKAGADAGCRSCVARDVMSA